MAAGIGALVIGLGAGAAPAAAAPESGSAHIAASGPSGHGGHGGHGSHTAPAGGPGHGKSIRAGHGLHAAEAPGPRAHGRPTHAGPHGRPGGGAPTASVTAASAARPAPPAPTTTTTTLPPAHRATAKVPPGRARKAAPASGSATTAHGHGSKAQPAQAPAPPGQAGKSQKQAIAGSAPAAAAGGNLTFTVISGGRSPLILSLTSATIRTGDPVPAPAARPAAAPRPAGTRAKQPAGPAAAYQGSVDSPLVAVGRGLTGLSLQAETRLRVPIMFFLVVALFMAIQALIDRRDPKVVEAPEHSMDDSVGFE